MLNAKSPLGFVAALLVVIGALNWGLVGLGAFLNQDLNVVGLVLGAWPMVVNIVYVLVGLSAIYVLFKSLKS